MDVPTFRADFPEFGSNVVYPDSAIKFWLNIGVIQLNAQSLAVPVSDRWGSLVNLGLELFTAHHIVLEAFNRKAAFIGGIPGLNTGAIASQGVDKVNLAYDNADTLSKDAGHWNLTTFGTRFMELARMVGSGGLQLI